MKRTSVRMLVTLLVMALLLSPVAVFGYTKTGEGRATLLQEGAYTVPAQTEALAALSQPKRAVSMTAEEAAYQQLLNVPERIDLTSYRVPVNDVDTFYSNVVNDHPDLFYVSSSYSYNYYPSTGCVAYIFPQYAMTADEIAAAQEIFYAGAAQALAETDSSMTDLQKALTLHDYLCSEGVYPELQYSGNQLVNDQDIWHSAYGFFYDRTVVCAGFALAYSYLLQQCGIPCEYVGSDPMQHAWNKVQIDGSWYNVDVTWDNLDYATGTNTYGAMRHTHFLKSDSFFASQNGSYHYDGRTYDTCTADSTAYDNAFWNIVTSRIYAVGGCYYYLYPLGGSNYARFYLNKRTAPTATATLVGSQYNTTYYTFTSYVYDENGTQYTVQYNDMLARLVWLDQRFYIAANNNIYAQLLDRNRHSVISLDNSVIGFAQDAQHNLIYQFIDQQVQTLDKQTYFETYLTANRGENYHVYPDINLDGVINAKDHAFILQN